MAKMIKLTLIVSLLLNAGLIVGFGVYKSYATSQNLKCVALAAQSETKLLEGIFSDLESGDPAKITALKERLRKHVEIAQKNTAIWQQIAAK